MDRLATSIPVDSVAGRITRKGDHFNSNKKVQVGVFDGPPLMCPFIPANPQQLDLTGKTSGRLTVIGYHGHGLWVVRCSCGKYTFRRQRAIMKRKEYEDRCELCQEVEFLRKHDRYRQEARM